MFGHLSSAPMLDLETFIIFMFFPLINNQLSNTGRSVDLTLKNTDKINVIHLTIVFHLTLYDRTHISPNVDFSFLDQDIALIFRYSA